MALCQLGVACMADISIASTWGFDQLLPKNLSVVTEKRLYFKYDQRDLFDYDAEDPNSRRQSLQASPEFSREGDPELTPEFQLQTPLRRYEFESEFVFRNQHAKRVRLAGNFNDWQPNIDLEKSGGDLWKKTLTLPIIDGHDRYEYKFIVNENDWQVSRDLPITRDKSGNENNYFVVPREID